MRERIKMEMRKESLITEKMGQVITFKKKGNFIDDVPDGKHIYYWENGKIKDEGN